MGYSERMDQLIDELMKVVRRIANMEDATPEEVKALAEVANVVVNAFN